MSSKLSDTDFDLFLFHREIETSLEFLSANMSGIIVDLENFGKIERQRGFDTEINKHTISDLLALRKETGGQLLCRISGPEPSERELFEVVNSGANEIIVPMLKTERQAERIISKVAGRARVMLMIETVEAAQITSRLSNLPVDRIYVGLNDLRISRSTSSIFSPIADGLLDDLRNNMNSVPFGFGGLTLPGFGKPLPVRHLYSEMARLQCRFTFLRRSFYHDANGHEPRAVLQKVRSKMASMQRRSEAEMLKHRAETIEAVHLLESKPHVS